MFTTAVRVERDLGVPSFSLNTPTGHRSCTPEDCSELVANSPQGPVPVSDVFPVGAILHLLETRLQAVWLSPYRADPPAHRPNAWARPPVRWHAVVPFLFQVRVSHQTQGHPSIPSPLGGGCSRAPRGADKYSRTWMRSMRLWTLTPGRAASARARSSWWRAPSTSTTQVRRWVGSRCSAWSKTAWMTCS